jgi:DNA-binding Lrp family transcriptional regulator
LGAWESLALDQDPGQNRLKRLRSDGVILEAGYYAEARCRKIASGLSWLPSKTILGDHDRALAIAQELAEPNSDFGEFARIVMKELLPEARELVLREWSRVETVAAALEVRRVLSEAEFYEIVGARMDLPSEHAQT